MNVSKLFTSDKSRKKNHNNDIINSFKEIKIKSIQSLKEDLFSIDTKLLPIEEEFKLNRFTKHIKSNFDTKCFYVKLLNAILLALLLILLFLNIKKFLDMNDFSLSFISDNFSSPIESILPEEHERERIIFN